MGTNTRRNPNQFLEIGTAIDRGFGKLIGINTDTTRADELDAAETALVQLAADEFGLQADAYLEALSRNPDLDLDPILAQFATGPSYRRCRHPRGYSRVQALHTASYLGKLQPTR